MTSLREHLRNGTRALHDELDASVRARGFFDSTESFGEFLARSYPFQAGAERALDDAGAAGWIPDWPSRRRAALLLDDLRTLGRPTPPPGRADRVHATLLGDGDAGRALGIAYVLEGSMLGAALILREIAPLGLGAQHGASFLAGAEMNGRWRSFLDVLSRHDTPTLDRQVVLAGANAAFAAARACMDEAWPD